MENNHNHEESKVTPEMPPAAPHNAGHQQGGNNIPNNPGSVFLLRVLAGICGTVVLGAIASIFTGELELGLEAFQVERGTAIIICIVCAGLGLLFSFWAQKRATAVNKAATIPANIGEVSVERYKSAQKRYTIFRVILCILLGTMIVSFVAMAHTEGTVAGSVLNSIFVLSFLAIIPNLILLLVSKRKMKRIQLALIFAPSADTNTN